MARLTSSPRSQATAPVLAPAEPSGQCCNGLPLVSLGTCFSLPLPVCQQGFVGVIQEPRYNGTFTQNSSLALNTEVERAEVRPVSEQV